jgi:transposase-like protein
MRKAASEIEFVPYSDAPFVNAEEVTASYRTFGRYQPHHRRGRTVRLKPRHCDAARAGVRGGLHAACAAVRPIAVDHPKAARTSHRVTDASGCRHGRLCNDGLTPLPGFRRMGTMTRHRSHSAAFKRQVTEEFIAGETRHALSKRHDISRQLIRIWVGKFEAGATRSRWTRWSGFRSEVTGAVRRLGPPAEPLRIGPCAADKRRQHCRPALSFHQRPH